MPLKSVHNAFTAEETHSSKESRLRGHSIHSTNNRERGGHSSHDREVKEERGSVRWSTADIRTGSE